MNNCSRNEKFFKNKTNENLGNIKDSNSTAYCLYWDNGPGNLRFNHGDCECNQLFETITKGGTKFDVNSYNEVNECIQNSKNCGNMKNTFSNQRESCPISKDTQVKSCDKKVLNVKFDYQGVM